MSAYFDPSVVIYERPDVAVKFDRIEYLVTTDFPGESVLNPIIRLLDLGRLHYLLLEDTVSVAYTISPSRIIPTARKLLKSTDSYKVAKESRKQALSLPSPPCPRPASTSCLYKASIERTPI